MKLAMIAESFDIPQLWEACSYAISKNLDEYVSCPEWESAHLSEKMSQSILPEQSQGTILALSGMSAPRCLIPPDIISRELELRRKIFREECESMDNHELRKILETGDT